MDTILNDAITIACYIGLSLFILLFAKILKDVTTPYQIDVELGEHDNVALALSFAGYMAAVVIIFTGTLLGPTVSLWQDLLTVGLYSILGVLLLNLARVFNDRVILYQFSVTKELIQDRNCGTGAVLFGSYIGSGFIIAGAVNGEGGGILSTLAFFAAGQVVFALYTWVYNRITPYCVHDEIEKDNVAAGVALGGALVAVGIILMSASKGDFVSWSNNFGVFAIEALAAIILLPIVRLVLDKLLIAKMDLNHEIQNDRNVGAALLEATAMIAFGSLLSVLFA